VTTKADAHRLRDFFLLTSLNYKLYNSYDYSNKGGKMSDNEKTTIQISLENKSRLDKLGGKGDSYDDILGRLLDKVEKG
jgi:hypothetical protein